MSPIWSSEHNRPAQYKNTRNKLRYTSQQTDVQWTLNLSGAIITVETVTSLDYQPVTQMGWAEKLSFDSFCHLPHEESGEKPYSTGGSEQFREWKIVFNWRWCSWCVEVMRPILSWLKWDCSSGSAWGKKKTQEATIRRLNKIGYGLKDGNNYPLKLNSISRNGY